MQAIFIPWKTEFIQKLCLTLKTKKELAEEVDDQILSDIWNNV